MSPIGALMRSQRGVNVYSYVYVQCRHRLSLVYERMYERKVLIFTYILDHVWDYTGL